MNEKLRAYYNGQKLDQGEVDTRMFKDEGYAEIRCGGTSVLIDYTSLHRIAGSIRCGLSSDVSANFWNVIGALDAITGEAAIGGTPTRSSIPLPVEPEDDRR